jgi:excinuclease ABC subunit C
VVLERRPQEAGLIEEWLRKTGARTRILSPKRGRLRNLVRMAAANAQVALAALKGGVEAPRTANSIRELARWLDLPGLPITMEAFDISTTQGAQPVGSRVFFRNARPVKGLYRHYAIESVEGQDDFAMMREVVRRSWAHVASAEEERPDLVLIDGGKGQVSSAIEGMRDAGGTSGGLPPVVGIAKRLDQLYLPDRSEPVQIPHTSSALRLLQRVRDEAHRFAITYHRKVRGRESTKSRLEAVPGIGPVLARRLLAEFGSLDAAGDADIPDLAAVKGMNARRAEAVKAALAGRTRAGHFDGRRHE